MGCIQPKKQFKVQIIGIMEELNSFYLPKMHLWKGEKKLDRALLPPSHLDKIHKNSSFFRDPFPKPGRQTGRNLNHHGFYTVRIVVLHSANIHKILFAKDVKNILTVNCGRKYDQTVIELCRPSWFESLIFSHF